MLKFLRKNSQGLIWFFLAIFILWGVASTIVSKKSTKDIAGKVFGKKISSQTFSNVYKTIYFSPKIQSMLHNKEEVSEQVLNDSVFQHIAFLHEAKKRKIKVTDSDIQKEIFRRFSQDNNFNIQLYENWVKKVTQQTVKNYEDGVRSELTIQKLIASIKANINVTEKEISDFFYKEKRAFRIQYLTLPYSDFSGTINPTQEELSQFFQENINQFKTEIKYSIEYIHISPDKFTNQINVSEEELISFFNSNKQYFKSPESGEEPQIEDLKETIKPLIINQKAETLAKEEALSFINSVSSPNNLAASAKNKYEIKTITDLTAKEISNKIGWAQNLEAALKKLDSRKLSLIKTSNGFFVSKATKITPPKIIPFKESENKVQELYVEVKSKQAALDKIKTIQLNQANSLLDVAAELNTEIKDSDFFTINDNMIIDRKSTQTIFNNLWEKELGLLKNPIIMENQLIVAELVEIKDPPKEDFEKEKDTIKKSILEFKQYMEIQKELSSILKNAKIEKPKNEKAMHI